MPFLQIFVKKQAVYFDRENFVNYILFLQKYYYFFDKGDLFSLNPKTTQTIYLCCFTDFEKYLT